MDEKPSFSEGGYFNSYKCKNKIIYCNGDGQIWEHKYIRGFTTRLPVLQKSFKGLLDEGGLFTVVTGQRENVV
jgi:hypothetical protein